MDLKPEILENILKNQWATPSSIQSRAIIPISKGTSVILQSQNGTGKTATFSIGILQRLDLQTKFPEFLIISPIKELSIQTDSIVKSLGGLSTSCCGGVSVSDDIKKLKAGAHCVSATPGRLLHLLKEKFIDKSKIKVIVLDEADEILKSHKSQVSSILSLIKPNHPQIILYCNDLT